MYCNVYSFMLSQLTKTFCLCLALVDTRITLDQSSSPVTPSFRFVYRQPAPPTRPMDDHLIQTPHSVIQIISL